MSKLIKVVTLDGANDRTRALFLQIEFDIETKLFNKRGEVIELWPEGKTNENKSRSF